MLTLHRCALHTGADTGSELPADVVWIDLHHPTLDEERLMEAQLGVLLPTREDMVEIETSSRLYTEDGAAFMTAQLVYHGGQQQLQSGPVTFVLAGGRLVTIRYIDPTTFRLFGETIARQPGLSTDGATAFFNLLDRVIDRTADLIETTGQGLEDLSRAVFTRRRRTGLEAVIIQLGAAQNDNARIRDSLASLARLVAFASELEPGIGGLDPAAAETLRQRLSVLGQDIGSLSDHATYISTNIGFLLNAAMGLINIEQNTIIKLISITSVVFLPLTLIASIYGMNFDHMPFLHSPMAFWSVCGIMVAIIVVLLIWFRLRRWI